MKSTIKILAIAGSILSLPLIIFGWGLFITIPLVILAVALDKKPSQTNTGVIKWALIAAAVGFAMFFGIYTLGSLGNLDTTGKPSNVTTMIACVVGVLAAAGVYKLGKKSRSTLPPR